jgi:NAD(P)-dependent dehydrogenase (short-subunit alcohol dehydrogenase family)
MIDTNLKGVWIAGQQAAKRMIAAGVSGSIVNTASILGLRVAFGQSSYSASKAAVIQLTKSMALEWAGKGVRVNALCPGYFLTEMTAAAFDSPEAQAYLNSSPAGRPGDMDEMTAPFLLLASDAGSYLHGIALPVDGGQCIGRM